MCFLVKVLSCFLFCINQLNDNGSNYLCQLVVRGRGSVPTKHATVCLGGGDVCIIIPVATPLEAFTRHVR